MSQTSTDAQVVAEFQNMWVILIGVYTTLARTLNHSVTSANIIYSMTALVAYEYIITLEQEMAVVWHRKWTLATWLFITNRYLLIGFTVLSVAPTPSVIVELGTRIALIVGDVLVLAVTWAKTARNLSEGTQIGMRTPLSTMLLRDAIIRNCQFCYASDANPILISRFLLNLRQIGSPEIDSREVFNSQFSIPGFRVPSLASIVGNMGEDLDHGGPAGEMGDEVENNPDSVQT
ncbi:hypothetical protein PHLCEN_2v2007 [Hermanssonia centrifuga]|uniref:DUF6533 domain-containing protein n=1 Tax=Hermanssonia centrifuga TaxID=98765 RepID=A0A2R6RQC0_9APHY|nr:hypothetical protein PHLCEN_2v2007 [Hermanssonia centrifuga]